MVPHNLLEEFLLAKTGKLAPDSRPLYAYKCKNEDYKEMEMVVRKNERRLNTEA